MACIFGSLSAEIVVSSTFSSASTAACTSSASLTVKSVCILPIDRPILYGFPDAPSVLAAASASPAASAFSTGALSAAGSEAAGAEAAGAEEPHAASPIIIQAARPIETSFVSLFLIIFIPFYIY